VHSARPRSSFDALAGPHDAWAAAVAHVGQEYSEVVVVVSRLGSKGVGLGILAWAIVVDICLFCAWTVHHAGIPSGARPLAYVAVGVLTAIAGLWIGWRHRVGTAFLAPLLAWIVLVPFAFASEFARVGFLDGLWRGLGLSIFGGFVASSVEGVFLVAFAVLGRLLAGVVSSRARSGTVILPPRFR
jgi:hypothetical protein